MSLIEQWSKTWMMPLNYTEPAHLHIGSHYLKHSHKCIGHYTSFNGLYIKKRGF